MLNTLVSYPPEAADTGNFEAVPTHLFAKAPFADSDNEEVEAESNSDEEETEVNRDRPVTLSRPKAETFADVVELSGSHRAKRTHHKESTPIKRRQVSKLQLQKEEIPKTPVKTSAAKKNVATKTGKKGNKAVAGRIVSAITLQF